MTSLKSRLVITPTPPNIYGRESKKIVQSPFDMSSQANKDSGTFIFNVLMKNR